MSSFALMLLLPAVGFALAHVGSLLDVLKAKLLADIDSSKFAKAHPAIDAEVDKIVNAGEADAKSAIASETPALESAVKSVLSK